MVIEGWGAWDAFYMTVITVTTVGYRRSTTCRAPVRAFTVVLLLGGVGAALYTFTLLATVVVEGGLPKRLQRRRHERMLETIKDHFIICGYGRIGSIVARQFTRQDVPFVVVERDPERLQAAIEDGALGVEADASREDVLKRVGIERARGLIAAVGTDAENVYAVLSARVHAARSVHRRPRGNRGRDAEAEAGGRGPRDLAVSDWRGADGADGAAARGRRLRGAGDQLREPRAGDGGNHGRRRRRRWRRRSILDANLRQRFGVIVVGIQRQDRPMEFNPEPDTLDSRRRQARGARPAGVAAAASKRRPRA